MTQTHGSSKVRKRGGGNLMTQITKKTNSRASGKAWSRGYWEHQTPISLCWSFDSTFSLWVPFSGKFWPHNGKVAARSPNCRVAGSKLEERILLFCTSSGKHCDCINLKHVPIHFVTRGIEYVYWPGSEALDGALYSLRVRRTGLQKGIQELCTQRRELEAQGRDHRQQILTINTYCKQEDALPGTSRTLGWKAMGAG